MKPLDIAIVTGGIALWLATLAALADDAVRLWRRDDTRAAVVLTPRNALIAAPFVVAAGLLLARALPDRSASINPPVPCAGDGVDFDIRDGLCYKHVPLKYQRR